MVAHCLPLLLMSDVTVKEYLERLIDELDKRIDQRFILIDLAITKAEVALAARLQAMNEFRDALKDQAGRMATRVELDHLTEEVNELRRNKANLDGRMAMLAAIASVVVYLVMRLWGK